MKVIVTGANGQLGKDISINFKNKGWEVFSFGRDQLDVTNLDDTRLVIGKIRPNAIIHSAAYTKVDKAESDVDLAYLVNGFGSRNVAIAAEEVDAKVCYISTDYVFDGGKLSPYHEYDTPNPCGIYGKSKLAGEELTKTLAKKYFIVRTSWVYGIHGNNFVKTMLRLSRERSELGVVSDQVGCPTYTKDLAEFISNLIQTDKFGIYHASNTGQCSWYEFAKAIFEEAGIKIKVKPITSNDYPTPAKRPKNSVLEHISIRTNGFEDLRHWSEGLKDFIKELKNV